GVEGWGPVHLLLPGRGDPQALLARLAQAWQLVARTPAAAPRPAQLLAGFLRSQQDLLPLASPLSLPRQSLIHFRHRLVCRPGERWLRLRSWECRSSPSPWRCYGLERCLQPGLLLLGASTDHAAEACPGDPLPL
ncbi:MAG: hypothetical protein VKK97_06360, partial [Synechococcaceae cyanobacterium]|nr:hypothetical protein [Synechococcaceae cyanobacterium]